MPQLLRTVRSIALLAFLSFATEALAQDSDTLTGTVSNINGAAQPGAIVRLAATRFFAVVDSSGHYQIARIPAGTYVTIAMLLRNTVTAALARAGGAG